MSHWDSNLISPKAAMWFIVIVWLAVMLFAWWMA